MNFTYNQLSSNKENANREEVVDQPSDFNVQAHQQKRINAPEANQEAKETPV